jgi:hypothetical protein
MPTTLAWKPDWETCKANLLRWWRGEGLALHMEVRRETPRPGVLPPAAEPADLAAWWTDPAFRCSRAEWAMANVDYWAEAFPYFDTQIGPGSLGAFLGARLEFAPDTVWYWPVISDPDAYGPIHFEPEGNRWLDAHMALVEEGLRRADGRYLVGVPDLIENLDTLAALRGDVALLYDLVDRPGWVLDRLAELNEAYFATFDAIYERVKDADRGNAFSAFRIWGPGKTAKLQCDISANLSPAMFRRFVQPFLAAQCDWLDFSLYHLDGTTAFQQVEPLLEVPSLNAIEWTPQAGRPGGGDPCWFDLYRRIRLGGKGVQAVGVKPAEVIPLVDAIGPAGLYILLDGPVDRRTAENLTATLEPYRLTVR